MSSYKLNISHFNSLLSHIPYYISMLHCNTPYPRRDFILQCSITVEHLYSTEQMSRYPTPPIPPLYHTQYYLSYIPHLFSPIHPSQKICAVIFFAFTLFFRLLFFICWFLFYICIGGGGGINNLLYLFLYATVWYSLWSGYGC
jgi:hypothetical protein